MRLVHVLLVGLLAAVCTSCAGGEGAGDGVLRIGVLSPFSGANASGGLAILHGYEIAVDEINAAGGINGRRVELVQGDASTASDGVAQVNRLAGTVDVLAGTYVSAVSQTASQLAARYDLLYWDTNALADELTQRGLPNFIRSGPSARQFAERSSSFIVESLAASLGKAPPAMRVFVSHEDSVYGSSVAATQRQLLTEAGVQVVGVSGYDADAADLSNTVLAGQQANPDVWLHTGYTSDTNLLLRTAQQQRFSPLATVLTGTGDTTETLESLGAEALEGTLVVSYPHADVNPAYGPGAAQFQDAYVAKHGHPPPYPQSMTAYVGMLMLAEALRAAGSTEPAAVLQAARQIDEPSNTYATGYGQRYDAQFQNTRAVPTIAQWQAGRPVTVYPEAAAAPGAAMTRLG